MSELNLFLKRFSDYNPLGILTESGEVFYKEESQKIVNELKSVLYLLD